MKLLTLFPALLAGILTMSAAQAADNVHFSGALVAEPCTLPDADTDIHVDFGSVIVKYLYQYERTKSQLFTIHLEDCDPSVMKSVNVTFKGAQDVELPDMLALDPGSTALGVTIALTLPNGEPLDINKTSPFTEISQGENILEFGAYIKAQPEKIENHSLVAGDFTATANFILTYQ